jgi:O-antigen/teichoic acid export membrane protein
VLLASLNESEVVAFTIAGSLSGLLVLQSCLSNVALAEERNGVYSVALLLQPAVYIAIVLVTAALHDLSVAGVLWSHMAGSLVSLVYLHRATRVAWRGSRYRARTVASEAAKFAGAQIAEAATYRLDQAVALRFVSVPEAGYYSLAATVAFVPVALGQALASRAYRSMVIGGAEARREVATELVRDTSVAVTALLVPLALTAPVAVPWTFGEDFRPATGAILVSLIGSFCLTIGFVNATMMTGAGRGRGAAVSQLTGLLTNAIALTICGPRWGATGMAAASTIGYAATMLLTLRMLEVELCAVLPTRRRLRRVLLRLSSRSAG